jgi:RNA recognition motif-containing protein
MNIFVSNLSQHVVDAELRKLFSAYGEVASARIMREERNGRSRGSAVVTMLNAEHAGKAIKGLHRMVLHGKSMEVSERRTAPGGQSIY